MKKICVEEDRCICCGACFSTDEEHFALGDNNKSVVISNENLDSPLLANAIEFCPTAAISIQEVNDDSINENNSCECSTDEECSCEECECENCHHEE